MNKEKECFKKKKKPVKNDFWITNSVRILIIIISGVCLHYIDFIQLFVDILWEVCRTNSFFTSVYFETFFASICYWVVLAGYPFLLHFLTFADCYKIHHSVTYVHRTMWDILMIFVTYNTPLMLLDTFMVKKYHGVDPAEWAIKQESYIQCTRALPQHPPTVWMLIWQLFASILLYDFLFFTVHFLMHKNAFLYKKFHALHHTHDHVHCHVTNQLTFVERITLVLSANFALKVFNSHPLTRTVFIPVFIFMLTDNHSGYDLPISIHRLVPGGLYGGAKAHYDHHAKGVKHYQPFLTYMDKIVELTTT